MKTLHVKSSPTPEFYRANVRFYRLGYAIGFTRNRGAEEILLTKEWDWGDFQDPVLLFSTPEKARAAAEKYKADMARDYAEFPELLNPVFYREYRLETLKDEDLPYATDTTPVFV